jgi:anti-sigma regulatory factor (Ser/Thr protein kinase)
MMMAPELLQQYQPSQETPAAARRDVTAFLRGGGHDEFIPIASLLVSELVTNSILHARGSVTLRALWLDGRLHVDVSDHGGGALTARDPDMSGRGLRIVDAFASRWGSVPHVTGAGRATWFELSC